MISMPLQQTVSVIIPIYNRPFFINRAVDSVLNQTFKDFELIIVDDGSTDNYTKQIIKQYRKEALIIRQKNKGVSSARNTGIANSSGQFTAFLDSDDIWLPEKLAVQTDFFESNPDALICQTEEVWIRNNKRVNPKNKHKKLSGIFFEPSLELCLVSPSAVMMRKKFFDIIGTFDESLKACEDYDLWLRTLSRGIPIYLIETPLIIKRGGHADQLSKEIGLDKYRIQSLQKILKSGMLSEDQYSAALKVFKKKCRIYSNGCIKHGREEEGMYYRSLMAAS